MTPLEPSPSTLASVHRRTQRPIAREGVKANEQRESEWTSEGLLALCQARHSVHKGNLGGGGHVGACGWGGAAYRGASSVLVAAAATYQCPEVELMPDWVESQLSTNLNPSITTSK